MSEASAMNRGLFPYMGSGMTRRRAITWGCAVIAALTVAVWLPSRWYQAHYFRVAPTSVFLWIEAGTINLHVHRINVEKNVAPKSDLGFGERSPFWSSTFGLPEVPVSGWRWKPFWFKRDLSFTTDYDMSLPIWPAFALTVLACSWIWRRELAAVIRAVLRRVFPRRPGLCSSCGYDRRGLAGVACPECGAKP
jgi:hypothetical protein